MAKASLQKVVTNNPTAKQRKKLPGSIDPSFATNSAISLKDLFVSGIKDMLWGENHLVKALPKMIDAAGNAKLKKALTDHRELTKTHASRLEKALELLGEKIVAKKCCAMEGLTISGEHVIENTIVGTRPRDIGIIMSALKVENFEITCYTGLIQLADTLGKADLTDLFTENLTDEEEASNMLTELSK